MNFFRDFFKKKSVLVNLLMQSINQSAHVYLTVFSMKIQNIFMISQQILVSRFDRQMVEGA